MENPKLKKGDMIIVTESGNGAPEGIVLEVASKSGNYFVVKNPEDNRSYNLFPNGNPKDIFIYADREARKKYLRETVKAKREELVLLERDLEILDNYASDEAYTAHKISEILKNKDDKLAIETLLKELKKTNYL